MRWWPFHRRRRPPNGEQAAKAKREAAEAVRDARRRADEIQREIDLFAAQIDEALHPRRKR